MTMFKTLATKMVAILALIALVAPPAAAQSLSAADLALAFGGNTPTAARTMSALEMDETEGAVLGSIIQGIVRGFTKHGINRTIERGVKPGAIRDTIKNPTKIKPGTSPNTTKYEGPKSIVVPNDKGQIVTVIGKGK